MRPLIKHLRTSLWAHLKTPINRQATSHRFICSMVFDLRFQGLQFQGLQIDNLPSLLYKGIMKKEIYAKLKKLGVSIAYIFGSEAIGKTTPLSDRDIGIVLKEPATLRDTIAFYDLHRALEAVMDIGSHILSRIPGAKATTYKDIPTYCPCFSLSR